MSDLDQVIAHLGAALVQSIDSDDQIIMGHVREAHDLAKRARDAANSQTKSPPQPMREGQMPPTDDDVYVVYMIIGEGHEHVVELATDATVRDTPYFWPSESYMLVPATRS